MAFGIDNLKDLLPFALALAPQLFPRRRDARGRDAGPSLGGRIASGIGQGFQLQDAFRKQAEAREQKKRIKELLAPGSSIFQKQRTGREVPQIETDPTDPIVGTRPETKPSLVDPGLQPLLSGIGGGSAAQVALKLAGESLARGRLPTAASVFEGPALASGQTEKVTTRRGSVARAGAPFPKVETPLQASQRGLNVERAKDLRAKGPLRDATLTLRKAQTDATKALEKQRRDPTAKIATMGQLGTSLRVAFQIRETTLDEAIKENATETMRILMAKIRELGGDPKASVPEMTDDIEGEVEAFETTATPDRFESADDVAAAFKSGALSEEEARRILVDDFGFTLKQ